MSRFLFAAAWVAGIILAKGFWLTTLAVFVPFYGWYLVGAKLLTVAGWM